MNVDNLLPAFKNVSNIQDYLKSHSRKINFKRKSYVPRCLDKFEKKLDEVIAECDETSDFELTAYSLRRSINQLTESTNKIWTTIELVHLPKSKQLCPSFDLNFALGTLIPTLYYSRLSLMVSGLSLFGVVSLNSFDLKKKKQVFYNLIRTERGWIIFNRKKHLKDCLKITANNWHEEVIKMYFGFADNKIELPLIVRSDLEHLQKRRNEYHYEILKEPSMERVYTAGLKTYFEFIPDILNHLNSMLKLINQLGLKTGNLNSRINELNAAYEILKTEYNNEIEIWNKEKIEKEKWSKLHKEHPNGISIEDAEKEDLDFWKSFNIPIWQLRPKR